MRWNTSGRGSRRRLRRLGGMAGTSSRLVPMVRASHWWRVLAFSVHLPRVAWSKSAIQSCPRSVAGATLQRRSEPFSLTPFAMQPSSASSRTRPTPTSHLRRFLFNVVSGASECQAPAILVRRTERSPPNPSGSGLSARAELNVRRLRHHSEIITASLLLTPSEFRAAEEPFTNRQRRRARPAN